MEETTPLEQDAVIEEVVQPENTPEAPEITPDEQPIKEEPANPNESARQSTERAYKELEKKANNGNQKEGQKQSPKLEAEKQGVKPHQPGDIVPPARLNQADKQLFEKLPPQLKKAFSRTIKDLEANATRTNQEAAQLKEQARGVLDAVQPFATKWAERGYTVPSAIASLAAAQEKLTNPETKFETYVNLGRDIGINFEDVIKAVNGEFDGVSQPQSNNFDITQHPQYLALQNKVDALYSTHERQQLDQVVTPIVQEMEAVRGETDPATGDYKYPELFDDEYLESLKPLVSAMVENVPGLGYGEALKRAHFVRQGQTFPQQAAAPRVAPRLQPTAQPQQQLNRSVSAAQTLRGRVAPIAPKGSALEPPESALKDARATTRWVLENLRNGTL